MAYIKIVDGQGIDVPSNPTIGYIEGDGIGPDITKSSIAVINAALEIAYNGEKNIVWEKVLAEMLLG